jgi:hypothetical protein
VEALFNLLWLALSGVLAACWLFSLERRKKKKKRGYAMHVQVVALAMLIFVLLPAVSLTDDLQTYTAPAESEHLSRRADLLASPDSAPQHAAILITTVISLEQTARLQTLAAVYPSHHTERVRTGYLRRMGNRAPPLA